MNAAEIIQAAIGKLSEYQRMIDVGPLIRWTDQEGIQGWDGFIVIGDSAEEGDECNPVARVYTQELAEMLVALHRTIDAQLALLNQARVYEKSVYGTGSAEDFHREALALAKAILGDDK